MIVERRDGTVWRLGEPYVTSDGFATASGVLLDPDTMEPVKDDDGYEVFHSFFLGRAT